MGSADTLFGTQFMQWDYCCSLSLLREGMMYNFTISCSRLHLPMAQLMVMLQIIVFDQYYGGSPVSASGDMVSLRDWNDDWLWWTQSGHLRPFPWIDISAASVDGCAEERKYVWLSLQHWSFCSIGWCVLMDLQWWRMTGGLVAISFHH